MLPNINHMEQKQTKIWGHSRPNCPQSPLLLTRTPASCKTSGAALTELEKADGWGWGWRRGGGEGGDGCPEAISLCSWGSEAWFRADSKARGGGQERSATNTHGKYRPALSPPKVLLEVRQQSQRPSTRLDLLMLPCMSKRKSKVKVLHSKNIKPNDWFQRWDVWVLLFLSIYKKSFLKRYSTTSSPHATTGSLQKPWSSVSPYQ